MPTITKTKFLSDFASGLTNDDATRRRITAAGGDSAMLAAADADRNGRVEGSELSALWNAIDDLDNNGQRASVSAARPVAIINALRAPSAPPASGSLARGSRGAEVVAAQELLISLGYDLGRVGADGSFGGATERAVRAWQTSAGLPVNGVLDAAALTRLRAERPVSPEYGRLFADGVLQTTIALGFDEDDNDLWVRRDVLDGLAERGFTPLDVANLTDAQLRARGFNPSTIDRSATYYTHDFEANGQTVHALVRIIDRNTANPADAFRLSMRRDEFVMYTGHGRRGAGPDFDRDSSPAGNFVIGEPYEDGHYALGSNDLDRPNVLSGGYQLMFFDGCNTYLYEDDFRTRRGGGSGSNLDLVLTNTELPWTTSPADVLTMLDGVMQQRTMREITRSLDAVNAAESRTAPAFSGSGFAGNPR